MSKKITPRTTGLIFAEVIIIFSGVILALYLTLGTKGAAVELYESAGFLKITLVGAVCLTALYFYDLYNYTVINNRRELLAGMVQAIGIAWILLALIFYFTPTLEFGRGTSIYSSVITLILLFTLRTMLHFVMGIPKSAKNFWLSETGNMRLTLLRQF
jgi:hypothetical protein